MTETIMEYGHDCEDKIVLRVTKFTNAQYDEIFMDKTKNIRSLINTCLGIYKSIKRYEQYITDDEPIKHQYFMIMEKMYDMCGLDDKDIQSMSPSNMATHGRAYVDKCCDIYRCISSERVDKYISHICSIIHLAAEMARKSSELKSCVSIHTYVSLGQYEHIYEKAKNEYILSNQSSINATYDDRIQHVEQQLSGIL